MDNYLYIHRTINTVSYTHLDVYKRQLLKWIVLTVIALCFLNLGEMLQIHWPSWLQWGIKLPFQVKIEQQGKADMQKHTTLAPTVSSKVSVTEKITISPISTKTPDPIKMCIRARS